MDGNQSGPEQRLVHLGKVSPCSRLMCAFVDSDCRSVHNTRIERLWYDVTHGFGKKWKDFFQDLEVNHDLREGNTAHIWLLHYLFLPAINSDIQAWVQAWNSHVLEVRGESHRSPLDRWFFSQLEDGPRGVEPIAEEARDEDIGEPSMYGIDWEVIENPQLLAHLLEHNPQDWEDENPFGNPTPADANPFSNARPAELSDVPVEDPNCPFTADELVILERALASETDRTSSNLTVRKHVWMVALLYCRQLYELRGENVEM
jgi:hypothetical protein